LAWSGIAIGPALRAKSLAVGLAERPSGQGKKHLFPHGVLQQQTALFIIPDFGLVFRDCVLSGLVIDASGAKNEVEVAGEGLLDGFDAAGTEDFEAALKMGAKADVLDEVLGAAVLEDEGGVALEGEWADLANVGSVFDHTGGEGFVELEGFVDELCGGDEHELRVGLAGVCVNEENRRGIGGGSLGDGIERELREVALVECRVEGHEAVGLHQGVCAEEEVCEDAARLVAGGCPAAIGVLREAFAC